MDDREFQSRSDAALEGLYGRLGDLDADLNNGALTIELEGSGERFVVSPNSPVKQIWVSALTRSFKLDWNEARTAFVHAESGRSLEELVKWALQQRLGEDFDF